VGTIHYNALHLFSKQYLISMLNLLVVGRRRRHNGPSAIGHKTRYARSATMHRLGCDNFANRIIGDFCEVAGCGKRGENVIATFFASLAS
jgi:hypothetical protein